MDNDRRAAVGAYLRRARDRTGRSQRQVADQLSALVGGRATVTRNEISRWERGERLPDAWLPAVTQVLGLPPTELQRAIAYARGETDTAPPGPHATVADLLPAADDFAPDAVRAGRWLGMADAERLDGRVHGLRLADDVLTGGDLIGPAMRELRAAIHRYRQSHYTSAVGHRLLVQIGELAQIAGWIASDAGQTEQAEHAYRLGITAARQAKDTPLTGNLAGSLAYQLSNTGHEHQGLDLARAAWAETGPDAPATARALALDRLAWAHTRTGDAPAALRALDQAHAALAEDHPAPAPRWAYWVTPAELEIMDARVYTELHRPLRAVPLLTTVLGRYDTTHIREVALYRSWLAEALTDGNEPEQAAAEARTVVELSAAMTSARTTERARTVLHKLSAYRTVPDVRDLLTDHGHLISA